MTSFCAIFSTYMERRFFQPPFPGHPRRGVRSPLGGWSLWMTGTKRNFPYKRKNNPRASKKEESRIRETCENARFFTPRGSMFALRLVILTRLRTRTRFTKTLLIKTVLCEVGSGSLVATHSPLASNGCRSMRRG